MTETEKHVAPETQPMFRNLLASKPKKETSGAGATLTSTIMHIVIIGAVVWASTKVADVEGVQEVVTMLIPVEEELPPPPPPPPPPEVDEPPPPMETPPQGFLTLETPNVVLAEIPPPDLSTNFDARDFSGIGVEGGRADGDPNKTVTVDNLEAAPAFTPFTVAPELKNRAEVARALERSYPPLLRDAGVGGTATIWFFIDIKGNVVKTQINKTSGYDALDNAALRVADVMEFSPALNRDRNVPVWVAIPIVFTTR